MDAVKASIKEQVSNIQRGDETNKTRVFLHLGVNSGADKFNLEDTAWNGLFMRFNFSNFRLEATFRCPDERGLELNHTPIKKKNALTHSYQTRLPIPAVFETLRCAISF